MQNLKKNWLVVWKMTWVIWEIFTKSTRKISKLGLWWDLFMESRKCMNLKFTEELYTTTMKNDTKFEKELTCRFKIDTTIWRIFIWILECLKNVHFNGLLLTKVWAKNVQRRYVWWNWTEDWCKIWRKIDLCFPKWHEEFGKFSQAGK